MSKLVEDMAFLCCIYDVHFRSFVRKHELGVGENITEKTEFVSADPP